LTTNESQIERSAGVASEGFGGPLAMLGR
jgi:hypothetical protein